MRKRRRAERRFAREARVGVQVQAAAERTLVIRSQFHEEIVRMLSIVNRVAVAHFTGGQQVGIAAAGNRPWLNAEHGAQANAAGAHRPPQHAHEPVDAAGLVTGAVNLSRLVQELPEHVGVAHEHPLADSGVDAGHGSGRRLPRRA